MSTKSNSKLRPGNKRVTDFFEKSNKIPIKKSREAEDAMTDCNENEPPKVDQLQVSNLLDTIKEPEVIELVKYVSQEWLEILLRVIKTTKFAQLAKFVKKERESKVIYPTPENVFSWTNLCRISEIKVVVLGQDPYHGPNQAHGLAFSVLKPTVPPPSLVNIFKEISSSFGKEWPDGQRPKNGDLSLWAKQGVLMLNAVLTVQQATPNSHQNRGWEELTAVALDHLNKNGNKIVFLLWGLPAQRQGAKIDTNKHLVLKSAHPSPLSANRGFFGCGHFKKANDYLMKNGRKPIDWFQLV